MSPICRCRRQLPPAARESPAARSARWRRSTPPFATSAGARGSRGGGDDEHPPGDECRRRRPAPRRRRSGLDAELYAGGNGGRLDDDRDERAPPLRPFHSDPLGHRGCARTEPLVCCARPSRGAVRIAVATWAASSATPSRSGDLRLYSHGSPTNASPGTSLTPRVARGNPSSSRIGSSIQENAGRNPPAQSKVLTPSRSSASSVGS